MISLTGLMGKITGKAVPAGDALRLPGAEPGIATGGDFAALVARVTQAGVPPRQVELPLAGGKGAPATDAALPDFAGLPADGTPPTFGDIIGALPVPAEQAVSAGPATLPGLPASAPDPIKPKIKPEADMIASDVAATADVPVELAQADGQPETTKESRSETPAPSPQQPAVALATVAIAAIIPQQVSPAAPVPASAPEAAKAATAAQPVLASAASLPGLRAPTAGEKPKVDAKAGPAVPNASVPATEAFTSGDTGAAPTSGAPADEPRGRTHASASPAIAAGTSLRAIVDGLPPVIQSELAAAPVSVVTGPSTGQQLGDQVIDMGVSGQWIDRMAREIAGLADGNGHSRFTLNPPHLGRLEINLWQDQGATSLRMIADTDEAARRLSEGRGALQADARIASLNLSAITIEKASSSGDAARDHQRSGHESPAQMQQQAGGQSQGQAQTRAGNGQQQGEWVSRFAREDITQQSDAPAPAPARRAADASVRFA